MVVKTNFQADSNNKEILPNQFMEFPYICMLTELDNYRDKCFPWHWHSAFEIDYVAEGEMEFRTSDNVTCLKKGDAAFINSGIMHAYRAMEGKPCKVYAQLFDMHFLSGVHNSIFEQKYLLPVMKSNELQTYLIHPDGYGNIQIVHRILKMIELTKEEPFGYEFEIRSELCRLWCMLLKETEVVRARNITRNNVDIDRIKIMMQYIHEHYMERITLQDIASSASVSGRECTRCFQRCIDNSPVNYLNDYRVRMAAQMLLQTGDSIMHISESCGFSSNSYFGKVFHESMGCTPMDYRKGKRSNS